jgi:predicted nucleotidyltransferase
MLQLEWEQAIRKQARKEERKNSIQKMLRSLRKFKVSEEEILCELLQDFPDDEENIRELMKQN